MHSTQVIWTADHGWNFDSSRRLDAPSLALVFGSREALAEGKAVAQLAEYLPLDRILGCSTAGEVEDVRVHDDGVVATLIWFDHAQVQTACVRVNDAPTSDALGAKLVAALPLAGLRHVFVLSDGLHVNGSELVRGLTRGLPDSVKVSGGLAGDGIRMEQTLVCFRGVAQPNIVVAVGLYGTELTVSCASFGGWESFGPERRVTRSAGNTLFELDGEPALALYKRYLGPHAAGLPASAMLFPLNVWVAENSAPVVRTILAVDHERGSITFAGDVPQGAMCQLMRANNNQLVDGAQQAAEQARRPGEAPALAILISCVGRRAVLKQRVEEELEVVRTVYGPQTALSGFYSYGEIAPFGLDQRCELHNQTMTITAISES